MNHRIHIILDILFTLSLIFTTALAVAYTVLLFMRVVTCAVVGCSLGEHPILLLFLYIVSIVLLAVLMARSS